MQNIIIVLGETLRGDYTLSHITKERVHAGIVAMGDYSDSLILLSAGDDRWHDYVNVAGKMRAYAIKAGVTDKKIIMEPWSKDTVAQIIFIRGLLSGLLNNHDTQLTVITHDWHMKRTRYLFEELWPQIYNRILFREVKSTPRDTEESDKNSIAAFHQTFGEGVPSSDKNKLLSILFERHGLYRGDTKLKEKVEEAWAGLRYC